MKDDIKVLEDQISTQIVRSGGELTDTDGSKLEPDEYFNKLKSKSGQINYDLLLESIGFITSKIEKARLAGQEKLVQKLLFSLNSINKELDLLNLGLTTYIHKSTINEFISKVNPKNSVKIIELERYPRIVPDEILDRVIQLKSLNIFDEYAVLFTDFTDEKYANAEEQALISRNKDPILFGLFLNDKLQFKHERMYVIGDWEDEHCDLTLEKLISKLPELKIANTVTVVDNPKQLLESYVSEYSDLKVDTNKTLVHTPSKKDDKPEVLGFIKRLSKALKIW